MSVVGIDLGTSNSVVAWENDLGQVGVIPDREGVRIQPSVVSFTHQGEVVGGALVGTAAKARKVLDPRNTIYSFKRLMGQTASSMAVRQIQSRVPYEIEALPDQMPAIKTRAGAFSPVELSAVVLDHMRELAAQKIGQPVTRAIVTVPANFNDAQRSATASAGAIAGLDVIRVLNEPTAAALAYGATRRLNEIIAVYDFGGGTFDLTVMKLEDQVYTVLGTAGDSFLGGDDIDERIVERMLAHAVKKHRVDLRDDIYAMMKLRAVAEDLKIELSLRPRAATTISDLTDSKGKKFSLVFELSHTDLVSMISDLVDRTMSVTKDALAVAQVRHDRISDVILVGGTTRIPYVRNRVASFFEKAARTDVSPDDAVAIGAALQGAWLDRMMEKHSLTTIPLDAREPVAARPQEEAPSTIGLHDHGVMDIDDALADIEPFELPIEEADVVIRRKHGVVIDVTPTSLGVGTTGGFCETLIWRSSPLPITVKKGYATVRDDQEQVRIVVCQGETRRLEDNVVLGDVVLGPLPPMPRGSFEIEVAFELDTSGMLQVTARDAATEQERHVSLDLIGRMDEDEVAAARDRMQKLRPKAP